MRAFSADARITPGPAGREAPRILGCPATQPRKVMAGARRAQPDLTHSDQQKGSAMTNSKAAAIGTGYFAAWSAKNVDRATEYLADDVEIIAPNGRFSGHSGYHEFMDGFVRMLTGVTEFTIFGDDTKALVWYDTHLQPVPSLVAGERIFIKEGKINCIEIVFDQMPLAQAFGGKAPAHDTIGE